MNYTPMQVFKALEDYHKWDKYIEHYKVSTDLLPDERGQMQSVILSLRKFLGEDFWLAEALQNGHPIFRYLLNNVSWSRWVLIRIAQSLDTLEGKEGFDGLLDRLHHPGKFPEAQSVLEVAYKFHQAGFKIVFDPEVIITRKDGSLVSKKPDLKIIDPEVGEEIFVEVSALGYSAEHQRISRTFDIIFWHLMQVMDFSELFARGQFEKRLTDLDDVGLREILRQLDDRIKQIKASGSFGTFVVEGLIEIGIGFQQKSDIVDRWASERGMEISEIVRGPQIELKDLKRLVLGKMGKEVRQLPKNRPGIIVITTTQNLLFYTHPPEVIGMILAEQVQRFAQLLCAVVTYCSGNYENGETNCPSSSDHSFIERILCDTLRENILLVPNRACKINQSSITWKKIHQAFAATNN